jgi:hypothetical protein
MSKRMWDPKIESNCISGHFIPFLLYQSGVVVVFVSQQLFRPVRSNEHAQPIQKLRKCTSASVSVCSVLTARIATAHVIVVVAADAVQAAGTAAVLAVAVQHGRKVASAAAAIRNNDCGRRGRSVVRGSIHRDDARRVREEEEGIIVVVIPTSDLCDNSDRSNRIDMHRTRVGRRGRFVDMAAPPPPPP